MNSYNGESKISLSYYILLLLMIIKIFKPGSRSLSDGHARRSSYGPVTGGTGEPEWQCMMRDVRLPGTSAPAIYRSGTQGKSAQAMRQYTNLRYHDERCQAGTRAPAIYRSGTLAHWQDSLAGEVRVGTGDAPIFIAQSIISVLSES
jgi:hypothetical protein